ncbi:hypothetical protein [Brevibacillus migulae]|uniref:hypothetical protein n=1 Tax=Brevibacillus migulae TaxID=1644114 RepID=UPI00106E0400|nr:hypothetical protein [Brevibacillus migulae]
MKIESQDVKQLITSTKLFSNKASIFSLLASFLTLLGFFIYMLGYSFLYGFYFGKDQDVPTSILELIIAAVPFNFYTVTVMGVFVLLLYSFLVSLIFYIVKPSNHVKTWKTTLQKIMAVCVIIFVAHISISIIFFGEFKNNLAQIIEMGIFFWVIFFYFLVFSIWVIKSSKRPSAGISGLLYALIILLLIGQYSGIPIDVQGTILLFICFPIGVILARYNKSNFLIYYPYIAVILLLISRKLIGLNINISIFLSLIIAIIFSGIFERVKQTLVHLYSLLKRKLQRNVVEIVDTTSDKVNWRVTFPVMLIMLIFAITTIIPYTSYITGKIMRSMIPGRAIQVIEYSNGTKSICGELVTYKDGVFYISNTKWEIVILKNLDVNVQFKEDNETRCN